MKDDLLCVRRFVGCLLVALLIAAIPTSAEEKTMTEDIAAVTSEIEPQLIEARRWFHQHPELSNREEQTAAEIARRLRAMGYEPHSHADYEPGRRFYFDDEDGIEFEVVSYA